MTPHLKIYLDYFDLVPGEFLPCEICSKPAVDIHHINGRGKGKDIIDNLMALCRYCHRKIHDGKIHKDVVRQVHKNFLAEHYKK